MAQWVPLYVASRLIGLDPSVLSRRAAEGRLGPTRSIPRHGKPEIHVSTRGLELASGRLISDAQIQAARAGKPLWRWGTVDPPKRPPAIEIIGATVVRTPHFTPAGDLDI